MKNHTSETLLDDTPASAAPVSPVAPDAMIAVVPSAGLHTPAAASDSSFAYRFFSGFGFCFGQYFWY